MERILIIGSGGAGKSTLSLKLGAILDLPVVHLDRLFWHPGWTDTPRDEWVKIVEEKVSQSKWIMDGNYVSTMELRVAAADTVIFLNFSRWVCLRRVLKRSIMYRGAARPDMGEDCPEKLDFEYFKFLHWVWTYPAAQAPAMLEMLEPLKSMKKVIILGSPREVETFLEKTAYGFEMARKIDDKNPANWVTLEEMERRLGLGDDR